MENKTAIDWYFDKIKSHFEHDGDLLETATFTYAIAKQKEKQQIIDAFELWRTGSGEQYYNETYGSKGNDETKGGELATFKTSSQTEILDEMSKIEKALYHAWSDYEYKEGNLYSTTFRDGWLMAIDWYKKQLK